MFSHHCVQYILEHFCTSSFQTRSWFVFISTTVWPLPVVLQRTETPLYSSWTCKRGIIGIDPKYVSVVLGKRGPPSRRPTCRPASFQHLHLCQQRSVPRSGTSRSVWINNTCAAGSPSVRIKHWCLWRVCGSSLQREDCGVPPPAQHLWDFAGEAAWIDPKSFTQVLFRGHH